MKLAFEKDQHFDDSQLYYQWLHTRSALPLKSTRYFIFSLWVLAFIYFTTIDSNSYNFFTFIAVPIALFGIPALLTLLEFLYFLPRAIVDDTSTELLGFIFSSPVSTGDIVSGLRKFFVRINILKIAPPLTGIILLHLKSNLTSANFFNELVEPCMMTLCWFAIWWFVVETGIFTASMPRTISVTGAMVLLWLVPILVGVFWGGYNIASIGWNYFLGDVYVDPGYLYRRSNYDDWQKYNNLRFFWYSVHYIVLLMIPTLYLFFNSRRHMEFRRRGRWI